MNPDQTDLRLYPIINIKRNEHPNRFYALPLIGFLVKAIATIPVGIWLAILMFGELFIVSINSLIILFTGKYWQFAYQYNLGVIRLSIKTLFYFDGLTDKYPGFSLNINDNYSVDIPYHQNPSRFFAIPILGFFIRIFLLIPYYIYSEVIYYAARIAVFFSFAPVLFSGYYPETTFELDRDSARVIYGSSAYIMGLSDTYPSFHISMNHQTMKIILIIAGAFLALANMFSSTTNYSSQETSTYSSQTTYPDYK